MLIGTLERKEMSFLDIQLFWWKDSQLKIQISFMVASVTFINVSEKINGSFMKTNISFILSLT